MEGFSQALEALSSENSCMRCVFVWEGDAGRCHRERICVCGGGCVQESIQHRGNV